MFDMDTLIIILLPISFASAITLSIIIWFQDRHKHTLTERRKDFMFFKERKLAKQRGVDIRESIEKLKLYTSRKSVQDDLETIDLVSFENAKSFLNDFVTKHPIAQDTVKHLLDLLQHNT